jgi:lipoyl(octanoyl) transferase
MKIVNLGLQDYRTTWEAMKAFTAKRQVDSEDELWIVEHPAVFTQGISGTPILSRFKSIKQYTSNCPGP